MNNLFTLIYRFFLSYDFVLGVQKAVGIFLPVLFLFLSVDGVEYQALLITGYGSLTIAIADQVGPFKHKRNELIATFFSTLLISCLFAHFGEHEFSYLMIALIVVVTFLGAFVVAFGKRVTIIGFLFVFSALFSVRGSSYTAELHTLYFGSGALFYLLYTLLLTKLFERQIIRHNLSNIYFQLAKYLKALSSCYRQNSDIEKKFQILINSQTDLLEELQLMRDLLFRSDLKDPKISEMISELLTLIDIREVVTSPLQDFMTIREIFPNTDIQIFFRDSFTKAAHNLEEMGLSTLKAADMIKRLGFKAELRALEYELEILKRSQLTADLQEGYRILAAHYRKVWSLSRQLERLRSRLIGESDYDEQHLKINLERFLSHGYWSLDILRKNISIHSDYMRYAIRSSVAMGSALLLVKWGDFLTHGFWIAFTLLSLMRPGFSLTRERSRNRILGTIIGCILGGIILATQISPLGMVILLFISVTFNHGLSKINNALSVAATSLYVLVLLNINQDLTAIEGLSLAGERILDTIIASIIAVTFSFLLPQWERGSIENLTKRVREQLYQLFLIIEKTWITQELESDEEYKLAARECQNDIVTLSNSIRRMQDEPEQVHQNQVLLNDELMNYQSILAQISYLTYLLDHLNCSIDEIEEFRELFQLVKLRLDPKNGQKDEKQAPFQAKELKPLIWMIEPNH